MITQTSIGVQFVRQFAAALDSSQVFATTAARQTFLTDANGYNGLLTYDEELEVLFLLKISDTEPTQIISEDKLEVTTDLFGSPLPSTFDSRNPYWIYWEELSTNITLADLYYLNPDPMPDPVGGLAAGSTFDENNTELGGTTQGVNLYNLLTGLLYTYRAPSISNFVIRDSASIPLGNTYDIGQQIPNVFDATWKASGEVDDIVPNSGILWLWGNYVLESDGITRNDNLVLLTEKEDPGLLSLDNADGLDPKGSIQLNLTEFYTALGIDAAGLQSINQSWLTDGVTKPTFNIRITQVVRTFSFSGTYRKFLGQPNEQDEVFMSPIVDTLAIMPRIFLGNLPLTQLPDGSRLSDGPGVSEGQIQANYDINVNITGTLEDYIVYENRVNTPAATYSLGSIGTVAGRRFFLIPKVYGLINKILDPNGLPAGYILMDQLQSVTFAGQTYECLVYIFQNPVIFSVTVS